jgi:hypothetical protein
MLFERPISFVITGISLAIMVPESSALLEQPNQIPGSILIAGTVIGAVGIYLGSTVASSYYKALGRALRLTMWGFLGLGMSVGTVYFGLRASEWWNQLLFFGAGCLPLFAHVAALLQGWSNGLFKADTPSSDAGNRRMG